jgi:hypothetical protein
MPIGINKKELKIIYLLSYTEHKWYSLAPYACPTKVSKTVAIPIITANGMVLMRLIASPTAAIFTSLLRLLTITTLI